MNTAECPLHDYVADVSEHTKVRRGVPLPLGTHESGGVNFALFREIVEMNIQVDHVHLLVKVPPRLSISDLMGVLKGRTAIRLFNVFPSLRKKPYWGNRFWAKGYCVDTVGLNGEMIQKYVRFQEKDGRDQQLLQPEPGASGPSKKGR